jgi:integrase
MAKPIKHRNNWRVRWVDENGNRRSTVYDNYSDALFVQKQRELEVEEIRRGFRAPLEFEKTFTEACDYWMAKRAIRKRNPKDDKSVIETHLRPTFGPLKLKELGVMHVDNFMVSKNHLNKKTISNHLTLLISILNMAVEIGWLAKTPRIKKPRIPMFSKDFRFLRTDDEIRRFLVAAREEGEQVFVLYATTVYTGFRQGEVAGLKWSDIDFNRRMITLQRSFDGPTKSDEVRYVPILDALLPILQEWRLKNQLEYVFTNRDCNMFRPSDRIFQETLHRILVKAGFPITKSGGKDRRYIVFHDLRHTFASHWVMNGGDIFKLQKILGHKSMAMTQRYAHLAPHAFTGDYGRMGANQTFETAKVINPEFFKIDVASFFMTLADLRFVFYTSRG